MLVNQVGNIEGLLEENMGKMERHQGIIEELGFGSIEETCG